jgi:ABC-type Na+ efflux pump permease subunit
MAASKPTPAVSNVHVMLALLAKDWRLFRLPTIALVTVVVGCYAIAGAEDHFLAPENVMPTTSLLAAILTAVLASAFGGFAVAGERADRTMDFLGALPVTRWQIILSKWTISFLTLGICAMIQLVLAKLFLATPLDTRRWLSQAPWTVLVWVAFSASFFGIAWLISTFTRSGTISACISIGITTAVFIESGFGPDRQFGAGQSHETQAMLVHSLRPLLVGVAAVIAGTLYYRRRVEP